MKPKELIEKDRREIKENLAVLERLQEERKAFEEAKKERR